MSYNLGTTILEELTFWKSDSLIMPPPKVDFWEIPSEDMAASWNTFITLVYFIFLALISLQLYF